MIEGLDLLITDEDADPEAIERIRALGVKVIVTHVYFGKVIVKKRGIINMATWMVHFRIAENLLNVGLVAPEKEFVVGNIGPDCGLPDKESKELIPSKQITHFKLDNKMNPSSFIEQYLQKDDVNFASPQFSFYLGYYVHLITDIEWSKLHQEKKKEPVYKEILGTPEYATIIKRDWYGGDFIYLKENKDNIFIKVFQHIKEFPDYLVFFPKNQISTQINRITEFYLGNTFDFILDPTYKFEYLTPDEANHFVEDATKKIIHNLNMTFGEEALWREGIAKEQH
ncbi:MAG: zinc dependent phospholipase C family protein [Bacillota bacterium]